VVTATLVPAQLIREPTLGTLAIHDAAGELLILEGAEQLAQARTARHASRDQVRGRQQRNGTKFLGA